MRARKIVAAVGGCAAAYTSWLAFRPLSSQEKENWNSIYFEESNAMSRAYRRLPLNSMSRLWGKLAELQLPEIARSPVYTMYSRIFNCNLEEALVQDLREFENFSQFFRRELKPEARPVCSSSCLTSPADGTVLHHGIINEGSLEQVKGVRYTLQGFLGPDPIAGISNERLLDTAYQQKLTNSATGNCLYHIVIYLSPGDYHRFHSPADWAVDKRRHFSGSLLSVSPRIAQLMPGLFCVNERALYMGRWKHGFFCFAAIGATNVGSISVFRDQTLRTNFGPATAAFSDCSFKEFKAAKGELFGEFNMGSTIVLLFEAPKDFHFNVQHGQKVQVGQSLADV